MTTLDILTPLLLNGVPNSQGVLGMKYDNTFFFIKTYQLTNIIIFRQQKLFLKFYLHKETNIQ